MYVAIEIYAALWFTTLDKHRGNFKSLILRFWILSTTRTFWVQQEYNWDYKLFSPLKVKSLKEPNAASKYFFSQKLGNENWCAQIYEFLQRILKLKIDYSLKPILQIQILAYLKNLFLTKKMRKIEYYKPLHWNLEEIDASLTNFVDRLILFCLSVVF